MSRPLRIQYAGAIYHVTNRGNERKAIYADEQDRIAFLEILSQSADTYNVTLHAFVLMTNHWHLLVETPLANLGEFMRHLNITYTSHYNRRHKRVGHLYQGRYKSVLVEKDTYLVIVSRYIHLNPIRISSFRSKGVKKRAEYLSGYKWSSLPGYLNLKNRHSYMEYEVVLAGYGGDNQSGRAIYKKQLVEDIGKGLSIKENIVGQSILGKLDFIEWVKETFLDDKKDRERPSIRKIRHHLSKDIILTRIEKALGVSFRAVSTVPVKDRQIAMTMLYKYGGFTNPEIGAYFGVDYSTVSQGRKRLREKLENDKWLRGRVLAIEEELSRIKI